jgi:sugar lactone lactonase YvrE
LAIGVASVWAMVQSQQTEKAKEQVQQETYVSKVVIQAPWGAKNLVYDKEESKPGEFGFHSSEEATIAPNTFTIAPNGDIYIVDPLNKRIQRFNKDGQFISVIPIPRRVSICIFVLIAMMIFTLLIMVKR